jgi:phage replication O-like protein O
MAPTPHGTFRTLPSFQGFQFPTTTPVPDEVFDVLMSQLSGAEIKVLLYICRRTLGFKKAADTISLNQIAQGITTKDGRVLDRGTGLSKRHVQRALKRLEAQHIIKVHRLRDETGLNEVNTYSLHFQSAGETTSSSLTSSDGVETGRATGVETAGPYGRDTLSPRVETPASTTTNRKLQETDDDDVCATLENFGISKKMAIRLAKEHPKAQILAKLAMVTALVETNSPLVSKNPQGFLVKAIEDGYFSQPPRGYQAVSEYKAEEEKQTLAVEQFQRARDETTEQVLEQHSSQPIENTDLTIQSAWSKVLASLKEQVPAPTFATWLKDTMLLALTDRIAKILVPSSLAVSWLEKRLYWGIVRALRDILQQDVEVQFVTAT